jgi:hypothetical protein
MSEIVEDVNHTEIGALAALIYIVRGQGTYNAIGSPDQGVTSLREGLAANLTCKIRRLVELVRTWLPSWSCSHVAVWAHDPLLMP